MSKSKGNVVEPLQQFSLFGVEQVRYYLLRESSLHHDGSKHHLASSCIMISHHSSFSDYSTERLVGVVNSDLINTLGNLFLRISSKRLATGSPGLRYRRDMFPLAGHTETSSEGGASTEDLTLIQCLHELPGINVL